MQTTSLEQLYRQHSSQMLAYLYCLAQDLDIAQEIWHETFIEAMQQWQCNYPDSPPAWFKRTAKNKFIDRYRHQKMTIEKAALLKSLATEEVEEIRETDFGDEQLKLIFTCCHPALDFDKQVALTLTTIAGLTTEQVADALLLNTKTLEQRLTRAKRKIKQAGIPFAIPEKKHLAERLNAVLKTVYLMYNTGSQSPQDPYDLAHNAIHLIRRLNRLLPRQAEVEGILALMLFHDARQSARFDDSGLLVRLSDQNRARWEPALIAEADQLLEIAMSRNAIGVYQLQAAIQGVHCQASEYAQTDWAQIEALYRVHLNIDHSPVVKLNAIFAISMSRGIDIALAELDSLKKNQQLEKYAPLYAVAAEFYMQTEQWQQAKDELKLAIRHSSLPHEISHFEEQIKHCEKYINPTY